MMEADMVASLRILISAASAALALAPAAFAQSAPGYVAPKTSWGVPDFQGTWTNTSITKLQRPPQYTTLVLSPEQAKQIAATDYYVVRTEAEKKALDLSTIDKTKPLDGKDILANRGGYDAAYIDTGSSIGNVKGEYRSSWIISPEDGKIPYKPGKGRGEFRGAARTEGPEVRSVGERCLVGFGNTGGPVMTNVLYNNRYQIVQAPGSVIIDVEMVHDVRIIPIVKSAAEAHHGPEVIKKWLGDSVGWYEGDTLVVETRNVNPIQGGYISKDGVLVERFTRWNDAQITYEFTVTDPTLYTQPWKGEMPLNATKDVIYEYACHEGNYALGGILGAGRRAEREGITFRGEAKEGDEEGNN
jgi:hypothetical protein